MSTKPDGHRIVVRRRPASGHAAAHGGSWKIAYADFMTAMMAFFLVMWLLLISPKEQLEGIAEHFRMPLKTAVNGGPRSSASSTVIPGGGRNPQHVEGEVSRGHEAEAEAEADGRRLADLKERLEGVIDNSPELQQLRPQLLIDLTPEGLRIQIVDTRNRPMFELSSARVLPHMQLILQQIAPVIDGLPNKITVAGHTDATLYAGGARNYGNWELSADRANASRRELVTGGLRDGRVLRVTGLAASVPLDKTNPAAAMNRRVSIVVLNREAQRRIEREVLGEGGLARRAPAAEPRGALPPLEPAPPAKLLAGI
ncbi:flagellar motor protein MotB [Ramlibacter tataouinensis]|uniref:flagellar motor protein MotB n=1 Tax=Ramlibacter tataouinensis TaxID=94132 RepID=UPI0022F3920B|nr:flagellar motor protein MotB [Ramlibacter tataouinensis]WBY00629.1 flagellar motor protein MotB [Ramlibacter tataouinensis]